MDPNFVKNLAVFGEALIGPTIGGLAGFFLVRMIWPRKRKLSKEALATSHLGWRSWYWDANKRVLRSPHRMDTWKDEELRAKYFDDDREVRCSAGIHAHLYRKNWLQKLPAEDIPYMRSHPYLIPVDGIVERFGRYCLGTEGWRAEHVVVRELRVPSTLVKEVQKALPMVKVHSA